jgi:sulfonate transport system substrate-binding protein
MLHRRHALRAAALSLLALTPILAPGNARAAEAGRLRIGFQKSSTLIALLKEESALEKALAPLNVTVTWHEFTSGLPIMEALNAGQIDVSADVADTVPIFAQAAQARIAYIAQEAASPTAQAILVAADSPIRAVADLKGRKVAVTKGAGSHYLLLAALAAETLPFKAISPAYLTPSDGRAALASGSVEAWVAWDPFLSAAEQQTGARVLRDGTGLSQYKRYYLAGADYATQRTDVLALLFGKLRETGAWVKANPDAAAARLGALWKLDPAIVRQANARRSYQVEPVTRPALAEQQTIADAFRAEGLLPRAVDAAALPIWAPPGL